MPNLIRRESLSPSSIFCVAKNYPDHAREMASWEPGKGADDTPPRPIEPSIFLKPGTALSRDGITAIPSFEGIPASENMHYEAEMVLLVGRDGECVSLAEAPSFIAGFAAGLDMTLRDVQLSAKKEGGPWLKSKGFRNSALVSDVIPAGSVDGWSGLSISLEHNGRLAQHSPVSKMTFAPDYLVHYISYLYGLRKGDLIFTGTPEGVGRSETGDRLEAWLSTAGEAASGKKLVTLEARVS